MVKELLKLVAEGSLSYHSGLLYLKKKWSLLLKIKNMFMWEKVVVLEEDKQLLTTTDKMIMIP
jgi:hypothetical protein